MMPRKADITEELVAQFWSKVLVGETEECWLWRGHQTMGDHGPSYGTLGHGWRAHRLSWILANGADIPDGLLVRHKCDNPPCVNPSHLLLGTHKDNVADMHERRRGARSGKTECLRGHSLSGPNLYISPRGHRHCIPCQVDRVRKFRQAQRQAALNLMRGKK